MSRALLVISGNETEQQEIRDRAVRWAANVPPGTRIEFKSPKRTLPQNDRMWAMLTDIAKQLPWHGQKLSPDDWKLVFLDTLKREIRIVPNLDGNGFVNLGRSSSDLGISEMADLISLISAFGDNHGVKWTEPKALRDCDRRNAT